MMSDRVVLLNNGYIVAEGNIHGVRDEMEEHPMQILIRCDQPAQCSPLTFSRRITWLKPASRRSPRFVCEDARRGSVLPDVESRGC